MAGINHKKWAERILLFLVRRIKEFDGGDKFITYGNLARAVGYPEPYTGSNFGMNIGNTLGQMGHMFDGITIDGFKIPYIQALVVNQNEKLPSDGLKEFYPQYPDLSTAKKRDYVHSEFKRIFEFGNRWEKLITQLGVEYNSEVNRRHDNASSQDQLHNPYGSEGSPEHIALRNYVAENPSIIGVDNVRLGIVEYPLKSGDKVDAVFITDTKIVGVEVKSLRSGTGTLKFARSWASKSLKR